MTKQILGVGGAGLFAVLAVIIMVQLGTGARTSDEIASRFVQAIETGDVEEMDRALNRMPGLVNSLFNDESALHIAARTNQTRAIEVLLNRGASLQKRGQWNGTALHWACWFGSKDAAQLLVDKGLKIEDKEDVFGSTPLLWAAHGSASVRNPDGDYVATVKMLIEHGASADTRNAEGVPAVTMASNPVAKVLQEHGAKLPAPTSRPVYGEVA